MAYLNAKNAPTTNPGMAMIGDTPAFRDKNSAKTAQLRDATISITIIDFVAPKSSNLTAHGIKVIFENITQKE
jgi:hypothetical protein